MPEVEQPAPTAKRGLSSPTKVGLKILLCVLLGLSAYLYWAHVEHRVVTLRKGHAYHSGLVPPEKLADFARQRGIRTVIDFRHASTATDAERAACEAAGIRYFNIPSKQVPDEETVAAFLEVMDDPATPPVLMHCYHGEGRAPLYGAIYRIEYEGWDPEEARKNTRPFAFLGGFRPSTGKGRFLREYVPRSERVED